MSDDDLEKVAVWKEEQNKIVGSDYYGAIGGEITYSFTPNGLGCAIEVKHGTTGNVLDLTDVSDW